MSNYEFDNLPKDVKELILASFVEWCKDHNSLFLLPGETQVRFGAFLFDVEWRVDSGLTYFGDIERYNPQE